MKALPLPALALLLPLIATGCASVPALPGRAGPPDLRAPATNAVRFWGHACAYVDVEGTGIVTDPVFDPSYALVRKRQVPAPPREALNVNAHLHSEDARAAALALGSARVVPLHFGAYGGPKEPVSARWRKDLGLALGSRFVSLELGESLPLPIAPAVPLPEFVRGPRASVRLSGVPRFAEVEPGFSRGGQPSKEGIRALAAGGYRTVVSLRHDEEERARVLAEGMEYVEVPMKAGLLGAPEPTDDQARAFLDAVGDPARRPVFVHCRRGRDRTGVMVALYRVARCGWTAEEAIEEMNDLGMSVHYRAFRQFIRARGMRLPVG